MNKIGFIGTGVMGSSMAINLIKAGYEVKVYNRTPSKAIALVKDGAIFCDSIEACVKDTDFNIMIVGMPSDVKEVGYKVLNNALADSILIDMTTSSPNLAKGLYDYGLTKNIGVLDAPVSGGDIGAKNASLSIMIGGDEATYKKALPLFDCMGKNIVYCGDSGSGQHTKMANQIAIAGTVAGVSEAIAYAKRMKLDPTIMLSAISAGAAGSWQMSNNGPKMISEDFSPGFFIKHFIKDMSIASKCAQENGLDLAILNKVLAMYQEMDTEDSELGTQAIIKEYLKER